MGTVHKLSEKVEKVYKPASMGIDTRKILPMPFQYNLKRVSRHKRVLTPSDANNASCYEFETRSLKDAILSRPDVVIKEAHSSHSSQTVSSVSYPSGLDDDNVFRPQITLKYTSENHHEVKLRNAVRDVLLVPLLRGCRAPLVLDRARRRLWEGVEMGRLRLRRRAQWLLLPERRRRGMLGGEE